MTPIDLAVWPRAEHFRFFQSRINPLLCITAPVGVGALTAFRKRHPGQAPRFTDCVYYAGMRAANAVAEFRQRIVDRAPVEFARIDAGFTYIPQGRALHANCVARYDENFAVFAAGIQAARDAADLRPTLAPAGSEGQNLIYLTCLPEVGFTAFSNPWGDPWEDTVPRVAFGKVDPAALLMPVAIEALHSFIDGTHVAAYLKEMARVLDNPAEFFGKMVGQV